MPRSYRFPGSFTCALLLVVLPLLGTAATNGHDDARPGYLAAAPLHHHGDHQQLRIDSRALGTRREVVVRVPDREAGARAAGVVYVLDADWLFPLVVETVAYLAWWKRIPPLIVVGIPSADRNSDLVPWTDPSFPGTGGGGAFHRFLAEELRPLVHERYQPGELDLLVGHSFGGVMALYSLFTAPEAFDAHIAIGASVWVADGALRDEATAFFERRPRPPAWVYMAVAEADGGQTVPAGKALADQFAEAAGPEVSWQFDVIPRTTHFDAVTPALHHALAELFPTWDHAAELRAAVAQSGAGGVDAWFERRALTLGPRFVAPAADLNLVALQWAGNGQGDAARRLMARLRDRHPDDPEVLAFSGLVENALGERAAAAAWLDKAITVGEQRGYFPRRIDMYRLTRERLQTPAP